LRAAKEKRMAILNPGIDGRGGAGNCGSVSLAYKGISHREQAEKEPGESMGLEQ